VIGTLAVDGWAVTFGRARRGLSGLFILFDVAPYIHLYSPHSGRKHTYEIDILSMQLVSNIQT